MTFTFSDKTVTKPTTGESFVQDKSSGDNTSLYYHTKYEGAKMSETNDVRPQSTSY